MNRSQTLRYSSQDLIVAISSAVEDSSEKPSYCRVNADLIFEGLRRQARRVLSIPPLRKMHADASDVDCSRTTEIKLTQLGRKFELMTN